jgi:two-component system sensor histidine kinase FlrB
MSRDLLHEVIEGASHDLDEVVRSLPALLQRLQRSYDQLREKAQRMEDELCRTNADLAAKVRELDAVKRHLEAVVEALPSGVVIRDARGRIVSANKAALSILGATEHDLRGLTAHPALRGAQADGEPRDMTRLDGGRLVIASEYSDVYLSDGTLEGSVEILDDRTERTALTERLHAKDKMAALGTMAAGIAHEIRNPLTAVKGFAALLRQADLQGERQQRWATRIVDGVSEVDSIIENLLSLGEPDRLRTGTIAGAELLDSAVELARRTESGEALIHCTSSAPPFRADRIKLRQAIRNLIANAIEASPERPNIEVDLSLVDDQIVLRVSDSGPGIPRKIRHRVMDPFFTTRAEGSGLGLALVDTIARLHGGALEISPEPSHLGGAEIRLFIPYQPAREPLESQPIPELER